MQNESSSGEASEGEEEGSGRGSVSSPYESGKTSEEEETISNDQIGDPASSQNAPSEEEKD